jgi:hypothetical protein
LSRREKKAAPEPALGRWGSVKEAALFYLKFTEEFLRVVRAENSLHQP